MNSTLTACLILFSLCMMVFASSAQQPAITLTIEADKPGAKISPLLNGVFFEDINFAGDGGIYPQRIKNGSFEFTPDPTMGWRKIERGDCIGQISIRDEAPLNQNNPRYLRLTANKPGEGFGISNEGFRGIGLHEDQELEFSAFIRARVDTAPRLRVELLDDHGKLVVAFDLRPESREWRKYTHSVRIPRTVNKGRCELILLDAGSLDIDMVSLFPRDTFNNRTNGLRKDLVQLLKDMKPAFLRFPGGCIVEGRLLESRYQWKNTIGDVSERKLIVNRWNTEFAWKNAPDYFQTFGLGFFEYFQLCEDIGAEPLPILNCGMACQFNTCELVPLEELGPYIQDALDLIEFANGSVETAWGRKRAEMGHPQPFGLKMLGIGNEQWGPQYIERYQAFAKVLKEKHPQIKLISAAGPYPDGKEFDYLWGKLRELGADIVDEHFYRPPQWFLQQVNRYDNYDRSGPKVFAGEFAAHTPAPRERRNNWQAAIAEAAFMTGVERNGDVVVMSSYAPLFAHVDAWQWAPNMIWFDNLRCFGTPSYYVQKLFSLHRGDEILPATLGSPLEGFHFCASRAGEDVILKVVNLKPEARELSINLAGVGKVSAAKVHTLASSDLGIENSLEKPENFVPVESELPDVAPMFTYRFEPQSLTILRLKS